MQSAAHAAGLVALGAQVVDGRISLPVSEFTSFSLEKTNFPLPDSLASFTEKHGIANGAYDLVASFVGSVLPVHTSALALLIASPRPLAPVRSSHDALLAYYQLLGLLRTVRETPREASMSHLLDRYTEQSQRCANSFAESLRRSGERTGSAILSPILALVVEDRRGGQ